MSVVINKPPFFAIPGYELVDQLLPRYGTFRGAKHVQYPAINGPVRCHPMALKLANRLLSFLKSINPNLGLLLKGNQITLRSNG